MMNDLISRKALCEFCLNTKDRTVDANDIMRFPSAEPEKKKGKWIKVGHWGRCYKCNQCGNYLDFDGVNAGRGDANFCPNCGTRMTRGEHE
jgi:hypothetical protein